MKVSRTRYRFLHPASWHFFSNDPCGLFHRAPSSPGFLRVPKYPRRLLSKHSNSRNHKLYPHLNLQLLPEVGSSFNKLCSQTLCRVQCELPKGSVWVCAICVNEPQYSKYCPGGPNHQSHQSPLMTQCL